MSEVRIIGICTNPSGEGVWFPVKDVGASCVQDCDCEPQFFVPANVLEELAHEFDRRGWEVDDAADCVRALLWPETA